MNDKVHVSLTGLPAGEYVNYDDVSVGDEFFFYNGHMSSIDNKKCKVIKLHTRGYLVRFEGGKEVLAYITELGRKAYT